MIKLAILGVVVAIIALQFTENKEYGMYIGMVMSLIIVTYVISKMEIVIHTIKEFEKYLSIDMKYVSLVLKMIGITYVVELASAICKDAGSSCIAKQIEIGGKFTILAISMPIILNMLEVISNLLN